MDGIFRLCYISIFCVVGEQLDTRGGGFFFFLFFSLSLSLSFFLPSLSFFLFSQERAVPVAEISRSTHQSRPGTCM